MSRMTTLAEEEKGKIEDALARLGRAKMLLRSQVRIRVRQAVQRGQLVDLVGPMEEQIDYIEQAVNLAWDLLGEYWRDGKACRYGDVVVRKKGQ